MLSFLVLTACHTDTGMGQCPTSTKCVSLESAWCNARLQGIANVLDAEPLDGGLSCQFQGDSSKPFSHTFDAGVESECPTPAQLKYWVGTDPIWASNAVTQNGDQCCYTVGGGCA